MLHEHTTTVVCWTKKSITIFLRHSLITRALKQCMREIGGNFLYGLRHSFNILKTHKSTQSLRMYYTHGIIHRTNVSYFFLDNSTRTHT